MGEKIAGDAYRRQHRGERGAYERYLAGMDASMKQKVALTAAHFLAQGRVADMGMGSGAGSLALASLYPALAVVGVDISEEAVARARDQHKRPNLSFIKGDIAAPCFEDGSLDGIFDSSVLHHVTSFNGYRLQAAAEALAVQARQLRPDGVLIVRDFLHPGDGEVLLDVRCDDARAEGEGDDPRSCSSAALLERFSREFRRLHKDEAARGFPLTRIDDGPGVEPPIPPGFARYRLSRAAAAEFILRKDYRADWEIEVLEEYFTFTQEAFERRFSELGLRVLASAPIRNPWIVENRFRDQFRWYELDGRPRDWPATNYLIVGERVPAGQGVVLEDAGPADPLAFLALESYRDLRSGRVMDLVRRPHLTVDVLPWFAVEDDIFILARKSYPRPILGCREAAAPALDGARPALYITEPLSVLQGDKPLGQTVEEGLERGAAMGAEDVIAFGDGSRYYPSPGGIQEEVRSFLVEVAPRFVEKDLAGLSGFSSSGQVRAIEARQALRSAQVGGLPNARVELNIYHLLLDRGLDPGAWIGEAIDPVEAGPCASVPMAEVLARPRRRSFRKAEAADSPGFLQLRCRRFIERDAGGAIIAEKDLEFAAPTRLSHRTAALALLWRCGDTVFLGLDDDDLPAAQCFTGHSELLVTPAWRLPREIEGRRRARAWLRDRLREGYGLSAGRFWELGGPYYPSPGASPERVSPMAVEVTGQEAGRGPLLWVKLEEVIAARRRLRDGHLLALSFRAAHALGRITQEL